MQGCAVLQPRQCGVPLQKSLFELALQPMIMQIGSAERGEAAGVTATTCETLVPGYCFHYGFVLCSYSDSEVSDSSLISSLGKPLLQ